MAVTPDADQPSADPSAPTVSNAVPDGDERLPAGAKAGEYVIEEHVGAGAMGDVYRASQPVIGKVVAVKVIKRKLAGSAEALERFVREARAVNKINHPNVVDVFAMGRLADGRLWLAMNYLDGEPLGRHLRKHGPMSADTLTSILRPVCEALAAAHAQGVVHRDLKSDNIFLARSPGTNADTATTGSGRVYVLDFGIAKVLADVAAQTGSMAGAAKHSLTSEGAWIGTPAYMAPEQWTAEGASFKSDVYALGIVAYEILSGRPPFQGTSLPAIMEAHFRAPVPPLSTPSGGIRVPEALEAAIGRALAKKPEDRPASAMEFLAGVEDALGETGGGTRPRGPMGRSAQGTAHGGGGGRRRLGLAIGLGAFVVGGGALAMTALSKHDTRGGGAGAGGPALIAMSIATDPIGAAVTIGKDRKTSPATFQEPTGETLSVRVEKPGYKSALQAVDPVDGKLTQITLAPIVELEGTWRIPNGDQRVFEHKGDFVAGYRVEDGERRFLRNFAFDPDSTDKVLSFGASADEPLVEDHADEPTCHAQLRTEYRYHVDKDVLEQRREQVAVTLVDGVCRLDGAKTWSAYEPATRLSRQTSRIVESRAGSAGPPSMVNVVTPNPKDNPAIESKENVDKPAPKKARPPRKKAVTNKNAKPSPPLQQQPKPQAQRKDLTGNQANAPPIQPTPQQKKGATGYGQEQNMNPDNNDVPQQQAQQQITPKQAPSKAKPASYGKKK